MSMGVERTMVWSDGSWVESGFALPPGTLMYGEAVNVYNTYNVRPGSCGKPMLHAIDLLCVDFLQIGKEPLRQRRFRLRELIQNCNDENVQVRDLFPVAGLLDYVERYQKQRRMFRTSLKTYYQTGGICFYRGQTIASKPVLWNWSTAGTDLMNPDADKSGSVAWFEKRLQYLPSKRDRLHKTAASGRHMFRSKHNQSNARE